MSKKLSLAIMFFVFSLNVKAQDFADSKASYDSLYAINITKSKVNGVYIPKDLEDAHKRILKLTPAESILKFKTGPEIETCKKLHYGIGRWMIVNWNFYDGSRYSHYLKEKGVLHPDDMAQFTLRTLHRHLNKKNQNEAEVIEELAADRKRKAQSKYNR